MDRRTWCRPSLYILEASCIATQLSSSFNNKKELFNMTNDYDSNIEREYHAKHPHLIRCTELLPIQFKGNDGMVFFAKADFYHPTEDYYIELKCHPLNVVKTKADSDRRLASIPKHVKITNQHYLAHGFNHSLYKQQIVQSTLAADGIKLLLVFTKPLSTMKINQLNKHGLEYVIA